MTQDELASKPGGDDLDMSLTIVALAQRDRPQRFGSVTFGASAKGLMPKLG